MLSSAADTGAGQSASATAAPAIHSHVRVIGASAAFGDDPVDVLGRVLDVARLAVDAILGVDLKPLAAILLDELVNARRAITLLRPGVERQIDLGRDRCVLQCQV